ncbi:hypothetical protein [Caballeronia sp. GACF4]|uniref:hypothetical protein n=1 Tax=Caballeronia sp. GACF4 TaxID=2921763 RepID=UPI002028872A|nr:hypothetical protein [Caballeronia sp. GACF4]
MSKELSPNAQASVSSLNNALENTLRLLSENMSSQLFPGGITKISVDIRIAGNTGITLDIEGPGSTSSHTGAASAAECAFFVLVSKSIDDLDLAPHAKVGAESLRQQFGSIVVFTSGRRSVDDQARVMAHNIVEKQDRQWIGKTYINGQELQKWVDDHPKAQTQEELEAGLLSVMNTWDETKLGNLSRHLTGAAFDMQPITSDKRKAVRDALDELPFVEANKILENESGVKVWHVPFTE